jgi:hypothetical protein
MVTPCRMNINVLSPRCVKEPFYSTLARGFDHIEADHGVVVQNARVVGLDEAHATLRKFESGSLSIFEGVGRTYTTASTPW